LQAETAVKKLGTANNIVLSISCLSTGLQLGKAKRMGVLEISFRQCIVDALAYPAESIYRSTTDYDQISRILNEKLSHAATACRKPVKLFVFDTSKVIFALTRLMAKSL
jgi:hypothetical protein